MNILQVIDHLQIGGAQKLLVTLADMARRNGDSVTVVSLNDRELLPMALEIERAGGRVVPLEAARLLDARSVRKLVRLMREGDYDVVHTHLTSANILGGLAGRVTRTPVVGSLHNTAPFTGKLGRSKQWLEYRILRSCSRTVIAVGQTVADAHRNQLRGVPLVVIRNAVPSIPADEQEPLHCSLEPDREGLLGEARLHLLSVGRLTEQKGYDVLLRSFARIASKYPDVALLVAGSGPEERALRTLVQSLGLDGRVRLLGARSDIAALLQIADIFVSSSRWEGLPVALLEALAAGVPVVATAVGDARAVVNESVGILVPPEDESALADSLSSLIESPERRDSMAVAARELIAREFSANRWYESLAEVYRAAASKAA